MKNVNFLRRMPVIALAMTLALLGLSAVANAQVVDSGTCGNGLTYEITGTVPDLTLHIIYDGAGTGVMDDYSMGSQPYYAYRNDMTTLIIEEGITRIGNSAFFNCSGFTGRLVIPNSVNSIGNEAFGLCSGFIGSLVIPNSVTSIGTNVFANSDGFTELIIGNSVNSIGTAAFMISGLQNIISLNNTPPTLGTSVFQNVSATIPVYVPCGTESAYQTVWSSKGFTNYICSGNYSLTVFSNDYSLGGIANDISLVFAGSTKIYAAPKPNAVFTQWNDGNTDNPRTVTLTGDITFTAFFAENNIAALQAQITTLQSDLATANSTITSLQSALTTANGTITTLQSDLTAANTTITTQQAQITTLQNQLNAANSALAPLQAQVTSLQSDLNAANSTIATLQSDLNTANGTISALQAQVATLQNQLNTANSALAPLQAQVTDLQTRLNACHDDSANLEALLDECMSRQTGAPGIQSAPPLTVYPNPVQPNGVLYIESGALKQGDRIEIFTMQGVLISADLATGTENAVPVGALSQGMYLLRLAGTAGVKFIVK